MYVLAFIASYISVAMKSTQQLQVCHYQYGRVIPVSYGMAAAEVFLISQIALQGIGLSLLLMVVVIGTGAWMGSFTGMWLHRRFRK